MKNFIFDLDNTLCECSKYYLDRQDMLAKMNSRRTGLPYEVCSKLFKAIDLACTDLPDGFLAHRFPRSFQAASIACDVAVGMVPDLEAASEAYTLGEGVFKDPYELFDGVEKTLEFLLQQDCRLLMCTKGDPEVQKSKIIINQLDRFFTFEDVFIVPKKTPDTIRQIVEWRGLDPENTCFIGDSLRDDIASANEAGITSIHITGAENTSWAYEQNHKHIQADMVLTNVLELMTDYNELFVTQR